MVAWLADAAQTVAPDLNPLAGYGILGVLLSFVLWLFLDERKQHARLREKVLSDFLPALIANTEQMKETSHALVDFAARPNVDPVSFAGWQRTLDELRRRLDDRGA